ncbi:hypothetical protein V6Z12_D11G314900 [Gossypium hirsutum]
MEGLLQAGSSYFYYKLPSDHHKRKKPERESHFNGLERQ